MRTSTVRTGCSSFQLNTAPVPMLTENPNVCTGREYPMLSKACEAATSALHVIGPTR